MSKVKLIKHNPESSFKNKKKVASALAEAFLEGDKEAVQDILYGFLRTQNKKQLAKSTQLSRTTIYNAVSTGNPSLETLLKIISKAS